MMYNNYNHSSKHKISNKINTNHDKDNKNKT